MNVSDLGRAAKRLAREDPALRKVLRRYGPPPLWKRPATFATFVRIILEQQVSLTSAKSTYDKLADACGGKVSVSTVTRLGDVGLRSVGFTRQKRRYTLALADDISAKRFRVGGLRHRSDDEARKLITARLGLGNWSADVFLMMSLGRPDILPVGDLALIKGMVELDDGNYDTTEKVITRAESWRPYRSVACRMVWQLYLANRQRKAPT